MSTVRIQNVHKYYNRGKSNELHVMDNISLELPESGLVAIFGRSGCGKTTLLNAIGGLDRIASGSIELFGQSLRDDPDTLRNRYIGYIFQNYNLNVTDTVYENVAAALRLCGLSDEREIAARVKTALQNVGLDKYSARTPDTLSGGQQQRVAIARALVKNPAIILADEPTGNLDETNTVMVMDILKEISRTHLVLLVTHEANLVDYYCDRVIELTDGRVQSDRQNEGANGYVQRNKNDIYLGELSRTEADAPGVHIEYYGEPREPLTLRIVHQNGKLYLKADDPSVKWLDEGSEIRLVDGVFDATPVKGEGKNTPKLDLTPLPAVHGSHYGRLYHWKNALGAAWRENFAKKKKKGNRSLRACLVLLAIVMVFMTAAYGAGLRSYDDIARRHNNALFYIPLEPDVDYSELMDALGHYGMEYGRMINGSPSYNGDTLTFMTAAFMTGSTASLTCDQVPAVSTELISTLPVLAGTREIKNPDTEMVITSAVADALIKSSTVGYIDGYEDLIGLTGRNNIRNIRIVGVVESDEYFYYLDPLTLANRFFNDNFWLPIAPVSESIVEATLKAGEVVFIDNGYLNYRYVKGDTLTILGKTFTVSEVITPQTESDGEGGEYVVDKYGELNHSLVMTDADYASLLNTVGKTDEKTGMSTYYYGGGEWHSHHYMILSSDPALTESFLTDSLGRENIITPDDILAANVSEQRTAAVAAIISVLVVLALMCLCVYFIMRSSFMARVREVGILRAIGVTKRNLVFRFAVEAGLLLTLTLVLGYILSSWFIYSLSGAALFETVFFYPVWLAVGLFVVIFAASLFFGVLPALMLLRKTPSEILSKYDI